LRMRAVPERLTGVITTRHYTNPRLPYFTLGIGELNNVGCPLIIWVKLSCCSWMLRSLPIGSGRNPFRDITGRTEEHRQA